LLPILETQEQRKIRRFVTGGESYPPLKYHYLTKRCVSREDVSQKLKQQNGIQKEILLAFGKSVDLI
jgi:hypothetical protein